LADRERTGVVVPPEGAPVGKPEDARRVP